MDNLTIAGKVREVATRTADENNLELVNVEVVGNERQLTVRVFVDKADEAGNSAVTHEDCSLMSHHLGTILDVEDFIPHNYYLEVSSPGIERELFKLQDYQRFAGQNAKLKTRQALLANQRNFRGKIIGVESDTVIFDDKTSGQVTIPFALISKANLEVDLTEELKRRVKSEE